MQFLLLTLLIILIFLVSRSTKARRFELFTVVLTWFLYSNRDTHHCWLICWFPDQCRKHLTNHCLSWLPWCNQITSQCKGQTGLRYDALYRAGWSSPCHAMSTLGPDSHVVNPRVTTLPQTRLVFVAMARFGKSRLVYAWIYHIFSLKGNCHDPYLNYPSQPAEGNAPKLDLLVFPTWRGDPRLCFWCQNFLRQKKANTTTYIWMTYHLFI